MTTYDVCVIGSGAGGGAAAAALARAGKKVLVLEKGPWYGTDQFLRDANPEAHEAMVHRFAELHAAGLWKTRRNSILAALEAAQ